MNTMKVKLIETLEYMSLNSRLPDYETGKEIADIICSVIDNEQNEYLQGFMDRMTEMTDTYRKEGKI